VGELDELAHLQRAHHRRLLGLQDATGDLVGEAWDTYGGLNDQALAAFSSSAAVLVDAAKLNVATVATGYMNANDRVAGFPGLLVPELPIIRNGVPTVEVYSRSVITARILIAKGTDFVEAMAAGRARAISTARTDVALTNRAAMASGKASRPWVVGYRRVLVGKSCGFCATASTQRYTLAELLPLHPACDCGVAEILGNKDPGQIINRDLLNDLKAEGVVEDITRAGERSRRSAYTVDSQGAIRKIDTVDGEQVIGAKVKIKVTNHPEMGSTLGGAKPPPKPKAATP